MGGGETADEGRGVFLTVEIVGEVVAERGEFAFQFFELGLVYTDGFYANNVHGDEFLLLMEWVIKWLLSFCEGWQGRGRWILSGCPG